MKLLAAVSHHGLGHLAQAGPVLAGLRALQPDLQLTVWSGLSTAALRTRMPWPFRHRADGADVGMPMLDAMHVDTTASLSAYLGLHADWDRRVEREANWLLEQGFGGVFSDVAYLPLAAAARAGIPALALCSLNWRDIAGAYLGDAPGMAPILEQMEDAYRGARVFLRPAPAMPMDWLARAEAIPPIAARGRALREEPGHLPDRQAGNRRVLVGFGGIGYRRALPVLPGVTWLAPDDWDGSRADVVGFGRLGIPFIDLLASCDALLTKVGYGSFVEAVAHGVPVLYLDRPDWPETPYLAAWLQEHGVGLGVTEETAFSTRAGDCLARLWESPRKPPPETNGAAEAALRIQRLLQP